MAVPNTVFPRRAIDGASERPSPRRLFSPLATSRACPEACGRIASVDSAAGVVKEFLIPGSMWFLVISCSVCAALMGPARTRALGRWLLVTIALLYWTMSVPLVAHALQLAERFGPQRESAAESAPPGPLPIVVLGNGLGAYSAAGARLEVPLGQTAMNTLFGVAEYRRHPGVTVIASGGPEPSMVGTTPEAALIRDGLIRNGIPVDRIVLEAHSENTREQAAEVSKILVRLGQHRCVVVTSPQQMSRAIELFRREGITVRPSPAGAQLWAPSLNTGWWPWLVPSNQARAVSRDVLYELMAWPYYRIRGWVR